MKKILIALLMVILVIIMGCDTQKENKLLNKQFVATEFSTIIVIHSNQRELDKAFIDSNDEHGKTRQTLHGFAYMTGNKRKDGHVSNGRCELHVLEPKNEKDFITWGHELGHCVYGNWHPKGKKF